MAFTNPQGKLMIVNGDGHRVLFTLTGTNKVTMPTIGLDLDSPIVLSGLQCWLKFDDDLLDSNPNGSGEHNASVVSGTAAYATGANGIGKAFSDDGSTYLAIDNSDTSITNIAPTTAATWEFWAKLGSHATTWSRCPVGFYTTWGLFLDSTNGTSLQQDSVNLLGGGIGTGGVDVAYQMGTDATLSYHHYCITYNGTTVKFFIDKVCRAYVAKTGAITVPTEFNVGRWQQSDSHGQLPSGSCVDHIRVYNRALGDGGVTGTGQTATDEIAKNYLGDGGS